MNVRLEIIYIVLAVVRRAVYPILVAHDLIAGFLGQSFFDVDQPACELDLEIPLDDLVHAFGVHELDEPEASALLRLFVRNYHTILYLSIHRKKFLEFPIRQFRGQPPHKNLVGLEAGVGGIRICKMLSGHSLLDLQPFALMSLILSSGIGRVRGVAIGHKSKASVSLYGKHYNRCQKKKLRVTLSYMMTTSAISPIFSKISNSSFSVVVLVRPPTNSFGSEFFRV